MWRQTSLLLVGGLVLSGCVAPTADAPQAPVVPPPRAYSTVGLESVIGSTAASLAAQFGRPDLDLREGSARKLQFLSPVCVLDAYLYPPRRGGDPVVTHVDARLPDGREMDRSSCVAALSRREAAR
ncbi:hypothetical protein [Sphingosinicella sp. CPCC 101087]|uniref:hypothetical protein n=1 Tax=Sphingosinicella sp. CPCC 101087 TaxID=2497754 RepID=UPI00101D1E34|nr:hypothetical protein [Sphingosinicella sp. CPCC 101087]